MTQAMQVQGYRDAPRRAEQNAAVIEDHDGAAAFVDRIRARASTQMPLHLL
jgi:hypothetical protein